MDDQQYKAMRKAAEKRVKNRMEFYQHVVAYVMVNAMLLIAFRNQWWVIFPLFGWGLGVIMHGMEVFLDDPTRRERAIAREMAKLGYAPTDAAAEKPKRERVMLADDGELVYEDEVVQDDEPARRRRRDS